MHLQYLPSPDISPILTMLGQCCKVLAKNGFVTPNITGGLEKENMNSVYNLQELDYMCFIVMVHKRDMLTEIYL